MLPRFYAPVLEGDVVTLAEEEAHHLTHVLRLRPGEEVAVFDGRGMERRGRVETAGRRGARIRLLDPIAPAAEPRVALTLAQAALKGDKTDAVIRDATMLGVVAVQPIITRRTIVRAAAVASDKFRERWRRVAIASAKQCSRAVVPEVRVAVRFEDWVPSAAGAFILVEPAPDARNQPEEVGISVLGARPVPPAATLIVGPEGGWDPEELEAAHRAGCRQLTLGARTLRADVASIVAISALRAIWRDF